MRTLPDPHHRHRFPAKRGVIVFYGSIRRCCLKSGSAFAGRIRRRRPRPRDKWPLDEVFIRIQDEVRYLWRAVGQNGVVLDIPVQSRRDGTVDRRFFKRLLKTCNMRPAS